MPRPHCMFIQAQDVPWKKGIYAGWDEIETKVLSEDPETGAATLIAKYPPGWSVPTPCYVSCHVEMLVLDGEVEINGKTYGPYSYAFIPAGYSYALANSPKGVVALTTISATPELIEGPTPEGIYDEALLVEQIDPARDGLEGWTENPYTRYLPGTGVRPLRQDPYTGEISILYSALPFRYMEKQWTHPTVQEMFVLSGEYAINDVGVMCPGSYAWWEPGNLHGPYGSHTGFMMFIRTVGGALANEFGEEGLAVDYDAPYKPVVSDELKPYAKPPVRRTLY